MLSLDCLKDTMVDLSWRLRFNFTIKSYESDVVYGVREEGLGLLWGNWGFRVGV